MTPLPFQSPPTWPSTRARRRRAAAAGAAATPSPCARLRPRAAARAAARRSSPPSPPSPRLRGCRSSRAPSSRCPFLQYAAWAVMGQRVIYIKSDSTSTSEASSSRSTTPSSSQASSGRCTPTNHAGMHTSTSAHTALSRPDADKVHASLQSEFLRSVREW